MEKMNVFITDERDVEKIKEKIKDAGADKLHILSDFDRTLTTAYVDGKKVPSVISILRDGDYISGEYAKKAHELFNTYHPFETDPSFLVEEKREKMNDWWREHFKLLINSNLNKKHIIGVVNSDRVKLRKQVKTFLRVLKENNIPLIIMSSAGLGTESISLLLEKSGVLFNNIEIISNEFEWNSSGNAVSIKEPIIHNMNKDETVLAEIPEVYEKIRSRKNVILIGDGIGDLGMIEGFEYENLLSIGFLNYEIEKNLETYTEEFDIVITNDGSFEPVNKLVEEIL